MLSTLLVINYYLWYDNNIYAQTVLTRVRAILMKIDKNKREVIDLDNIPDLRDTFIVNWSFVYRL